LAVETIIFPKRFARTGNQFTPYRFDSVRGLLRRNAKQKVQIPSIRTGQYDEPITPPGSLKQI
jgi:hypothetical protein